MEDMIINPMWLYIIETIDNLHFSLFIAMAVSSLIMLALFNEKETTPINNIEELNKIDKNIKRLCIAIVAMFTINIFIPTKQTMYAMFVSSYITKQNVEMVRGNIKESIDYIFDKIRSSENGR